MPTVAAYNQIAVTDLGQVLDVRGSTDLEITISNAAVFLRFAHRFSNVTGGLGVEELHQPKLLNVSDEDIDQVFVRNAIPGQPVTSQAVITVIATRG